MNESEKPLIQIDDLIRPMTDEEYAEWLTRSVVEPLPRPPIPGE